MRQATFATRLASVPWHHVAVECSCGHSALVPVAVALEKLPDGTVADLLDRVRCGRCNARRCVVNARLIFAGASAEAIRSAPDTSVHLPDGWQI